MAKRLIRAALLVLSVPTLAMAGHRYHASALAVGGEDAPSIGSVSLSAAGGEGVATVRDHDDGLVRFAEAQSVVRGTRDGNVAVTSSVVTIRDLDIAGRIHADLVIARVNERHAAGADEAEITFEGSTIENLTIDGVPVATKFDIAYFAARPTFAAMRDAGSRNGMSICTAFQTGTCAAERPASWSIDIPELGTLTLGEVFVKHGHRQLNMLRLERNRPHQTREDRRFGAPAGEDARRTIVIGSTEGNGTDFLP